MRRSSSGSSSSGSGAIAVRLELERERFGLGLVEVVRQDGVGDVGRGDRPVLVAQVEERLERPRQQPVVVRSW